MTSPILPPQNDALADLIRAEMQKILVASPGAPVEPPLQPTAPATIKIPVNGQTYEFANEAQLGEAIQKVVAESQAAIQAAQGQAAQAAQSAQPTVAPKGMELEAFVERLKADPGDGINGALKAKYGVGMEELVAAAQQMQATNEAMVAGRFKEVHPEFVPNQANAALINQTRQYLGLPYTVDGLEAAYMMAVSRGVVKPDWSQVSQQQGQQQAQQSTPPQQYNWQPPPQQGGSTAQYGLANFAGRVQPPPSLGGRGGTEPPPDLIAMAHQMTAPQLEKFLQDNSHLFPGGQ